MRSLGQGLLDSKTCSYRTVQNTTGQHTHCIIQGHVHIRTRLDYVLNYRTVQNTTGQHIHCIIQGHAHIRTRLRLCVELPHSSTHNRTTYTLHYTRTLCICRNNKSVTLQRKTCVRFLVDTQMFLHLVSLRAGSGLT
jgi:hypothetical protein